jgi:pyruvate dehydrogenase E1 component
MSNEEYQSLFALRGGDLRPAFLRGADESVRRFVSDITDDELVPLVQNLGGHDLGVLLDAYRECDEVTERPSVVFAYTIKGWGLPIAGDPLNHSAMLSATQVDALRAEMGLTLGDEWDRFAEDSPEGRAAVRAGGEVNNVPVAPRPLLPVPDSVGVMAGAKPVSTQETFGRLLTGLGSVEGVADRIVTLSPDVSVSTNLGGWINKFGVFHPEEQPDYLGDDRLLRWRQGPDGRHIELGLSEMNLFLALHALGLGHELHGEHLIPIGTVYDPFVCRGLDALIYAVYNGARFIVVGTPAGVTLAPEGGAHQSTVTASIGIELPGLTFAEPCFAQTLDWLLCDGIRALGEPDGEAMYLRLSTRQVDQRAFVDALTRVGPDRLRADVLAGGYRLVEPSAAPAAGEHVVLAGCGAVMPELVHAAIALEAEGVSATVLDLTSPDRLYREWRGSLQRSSRAASVAQLASVHLASLIPLAERTSPIVTVHDAASHALAWLGSVFGQRTLPVGVDQFGQSGAIVDSYDASTSSPPNHERRAHRPHPLSGDGESVHSPSEPRRRVGAKEPRGPGVPRLQRLAPEGRVVWWNDGHRNWSSHDRRNELSAKRWGSRAHRRRDGGGGAAAPQAEARRRAPDLRSSRLRGGRRGPHHRTRPGVPDHFWVNPFAHSFGT